MHIILLRHASRADKDDSDWFSPKSDLRIYKPDHWLAAYDPPLNPFLALKEVELAYKKISSHIPSASRVFMHCSPYNRCVQTARLLSKHFVHTDSGIQSQANPAIQRTLKLRIDLGLSEWLNENFRLDYLPPNDGGASMISNVNLYFENAVNSLSPSDDGNSELKVLKDPDWLHNKFGKCGDYGELPSEFQLRCANYLGDLVQFYETHVPEELKEESVILIITHGALVSTFLQLILGRRNYSEIPVCTPIYLKNGQPECYLFKDYDFNLKSFVPVTKDQEIYYLLNTEFKLTDLNSKATIQDQSPIFIKDNSRSESHSSQTIHRPRSRTINAVGPGTDSNNKKVAPLRQVRSSRQLHLMGNATKGKILDLNKLQGFLGVTSDSDDESDVQICSQDSSCSEIDVSSSVLHLREAIIEKSSNTSHDIAGDRNSVLKIKNSGFPISLQAGFENLHGKRERWTEASCKENRSSSNYTTILESKEDSITEEMSENDDFSSEILPFVRPNNKKSKEDNPVLKNPDTYRIAEKSKGSLKRILYGSPTKQTQLGEDNLTWLGSNMKNQVA
ncbi:hypothetical protein KL910_000540 [Ogataea haglerorum]|nr:hypothetical protein KL945_004746 [Ogataea haglerorum]KAG7793845.1 hypothetical protein KL910_000540 [Ogataea haglerorum]